MFFKEEKMKKLLALLLFCAFSSYAAEVNLIPAPFKGWWNPPASQITFANGIITITANPDAKANIYQKAQARLTVKGDAVKKKKFEFSFKYRTAKFSGALQLAIREVLSKGGIYHGFNLKKWDVSKEWKECKVTFTTRQDAKELNLYIVGRYMKEGEKVEIKDLKVIEK